MNFAAVCFLGVEVEMSFNGLRLEYALEGSSNYVAWKDRMEAVLDDKKINDGDRVGGSQSQRVEGGIV